MTIVQDVPEAPEVLAAAEDEQRHDQPAHGFTKRGQAVHKKTLDHLPTRTGYQRFNKKLAVGITSTVGTMTSAYIFTVLSLVSLPAVLSDVSPKTFGSIFPHWLVSASLILLIAWIAQTFLQLVLLPVIIVGQNVQAEASDARAGKTFEDVEDAKTCIRQALNLLDIHTEGGLKDVLDAIEALKGSLTAAAPGTTAPA